MCRRGRQCKGMQRCERQNCKSPLDTPRAHAIFRHPFHEVSLAPVGGRAVAASGETARRAPNRALVYAFVSKERRMMRMKIGGWLLILALVAAPGAARAQDLQRWWHAPEARD